MSRRLLRGRRVVRKQASIGMAVVQALEPRRLLTTLMSESFEAGFPSGWTLSPATGASWGAVDSAFGGEGAFRGSYKGYCAGVGYAGTSTTPAYPDAMLTTMSRSIDLTGLPNASLGFAFKMPSIGSGDKFSVLLDSTTVYSVSSPSSGWAQVGIGLFTYLGSSHTLTFQFSSDASGTGEGIYIDDILLSVNDPPAVIDRQPAPSSTITSSATSIDVTFSEAVRSSGTGSVDATDLVLSGSAYVPGTTTVGTPTRTTGDTWRFPVSGLSSGTLNVMLAPDEHDIDDLTSLGLASVSWSYTVSLPTLVTVGTGTGTWNYPLSSSYHDARTQVIYLGSEIGGSGSISSLALDITQVPGQTLNGFTIRMKQTSLATYSTASWDNSGWTTVYQGNEAITATGWRTLPFPTPFLYNNGVNLLVDFSFNNSSFTSDGYVHYSTTAGNRSLYYRTDSAYGDPLTWGGTTPLGTLTAKVPNIRLVLTSALVVPVNVVASDGAYPDRVQISWGASPSALGYEVWRSTTSNSGSAVKISGDDVVGTSYDDTSAVAGTTYYYWVKARDAQTTSGFSPSDSGYLLTVPAAPANVSASDGAYADKVRLSWSASTMATGYEVWRSTTNDSTTATKITDSDVAGTGYDDTTAAAETTYYYWVKATNILGAGGFSSSDAGYLMRTPAASTGVSASNGTYSTRIRITWSASAMAAGYEVWRNTVNDSTSATRLSTIDGTGTLYDDFTAAFGVPYFYWVKAKNVVGTSDLSASDPGYVLPPAPTGVSASDGTYVGKVRVSWTASTGANGYEVWRNTTSNSSTATKITASDVVGTFFDDDSVALGTVYYYWIRATSAVGGSVFSASNSGYGMMPPPVPTGVTATDGTYIDRVRVSWSAVAGASGYQVWRNTTNDTSTATKVSDVSGTAWDDTTAAQGSAYYYWVRSTNVAGVGSFSAADAGYLLPVLYVDASATGTGTGLNWANALTTLTSALSLASSGSEIHVAAGTYRPTQTTDRTISFQLKSGVAVLGGYAGNGAAVPDARDGALYTTVLSGDIGRPGDKTDNSYHVVAGSSVDGAAILDGFTITGGNAVGTGGGLYLSAASPRVINCRFIANSASTFGGGAFSASSSSPVFINDVFVGNSAWMGGGAAAEGANPTYVNCTFSGNTASDSEAAINHANSGQSTIVNSIIWGNSSLDGTEASLASAQLVASYSDVGGGYKSGEGPGNVSVDPQFFRNPSPGPDGAWGTADDDYGDLRLRAFSPVADLGNNTASQLVGIGTDMAGNPRFADIATAPDGGSGASPIIDIGAYEAQPALDASAGGPYRVCQGSVVALTGLGSSDVPGALTYAWDLDDDGLYDDAAGARPSIPTSDYAASTTRPVRLRVTDAGGNSIFAATTLTTVPAILYVDDSATGAATGQNWADAFTSLQTALGAAVAGCEIRVAGGTYKPTTTTDRSISFQLKDKVRITGGYAGFGAANPNARDIALYRSVLSGDIGTSNTRTDNSAHVIFAVGISSATVLDGLMITAGYGSTGPGTPGGGGLYLLSSSPTLLNCSLAGNYGLNGGAITMSWDSAPVLTNCVFVGNTSSSGSVLNGYSASAPVLTNCTVVATGSGSALYGYTPMTLRNSILWSTSSPGGSLIDGSATITYSDVQNGWTGTGNINADPLFVRNPSPGADNTWGTADDDYGDLRLQAASPARNAGNNALIPVGVTTDLAAGPRIIGGTVDMGAYELDQAPTDLSLPQATISENCPAGTPMGTFTTSDSDPGDSFTYTLVSGTGGDDNASFTIMGNELRTAASFDYEAKSSYSIRVRSTDQGGLWCEKTFTISVTDVDEIAPIISSVSINDGATQRSMVKKLSVTFSEPVILSADALSVRLSGGSAVPSTTISLTNPSGDQMTYILTFSGSGVVGGSLADGIYDLVVSAAGVQDLAGNVLTADYTRRFHRLFGDSDGNRVVNALDYARLKNALGRAPTDPLFNGAFDYEANNLINALDLARFRQRYGLSVSY